MMDHYVDQAHSRILLFIADADGIYLTLRMIVHEAKEQIVCSVSLERKCEAGRRHALAVLLNNFNHELFYGFWSVDEAEGEVKFHYGIDVQGVDLTAGFVGNLISNTIGAICDCYEKIDAFMSGASMSEVSVQDVTLRLSIVPSRNRAREDPPPPSCCCRLV
jgi:hypothetical protein